MRNPQIERPSLALLAAIVIAIIPSSVWAAASVGKGSNNPPSVTTNAATAIATTSASLAAAVTPNNHSTAYRFVWGPTTTYGTSTAWASAGSGGSAQSVTAAITGLAPATTYHFQVVAWNNDGTVYGADRSFTTLPLLPLATTAAATAIDQTTATLNGDVNPNGGATTYHFDFGPTTAYGSRWPAADAPAGSDSLSHSLLQVLTGLLPGTTYHFRAVATNASGATLGADQQFTTAGTPPPPTAPASPIVDALPPATPPVLGQSATIAAVSGTVLVELPGSDHSLSLDAASTVPVGTTIDATAGRVKLTNVRNSSGKLQSGTFWGGSFAVGQARRKHSPTVLTLTAPLTCGKARHLTSLAGKTPKARQLWGRDNNGSYVTRGRSAVATVRGTVWLLRDTCAGTFVKVTRGEVAVRDLVRKRTVVVSAGHSYLAHSH